MSVVGCHKMWSRDDGDLASEDGRTIIGAFTVGYQIIHSVNDDLLSVIDEATLVGPDPLPRNGDLFPNTDSIFCIGAKPQRAAPILTIAIVSYKGQVGPSGKSDSPTNQPPTYSIKSKITQAEVDEDWNGVPIVTANNEPIYGVKRDIVDNVLSIKRKFLTASAQLAGIYAQATNSDSFSVPGFTDVWQPGQAKLVDYQVDTVFGASGSTYVDVSATIELRTPYRTTADKAWYSRVRHEGLFVRITRSSLEFVTRATDDNKEPVTKPVLLDVDGFRVDDPANATWREFQLYDSLPYSTLGLW
jgi:hypothetical protein